MNFLSNLKNSSSYYFNNAIKASIQINNTLTSIYKSVVGKILRNSINENILEGVGYYAGQAIGSASVSPITAIALKKLGIVCGHAGIMITAYKTIHTVTTIDKSKVTLQQSAKAVGLAASTVLFYLYLPDLISDVGEKIGRELGTVIGGMAGGILGGYTAIYLYGSEEELLTYPLSKTYVVKSIKSIAATTLANPFLFSSVGISGGIFRFFLDQSVGSVAYNSSEISDFTQKWQENRVLTPYLKGSFVLIHSVLEEMIKDQVNTIGGSKNFLIEEISRSICKGVLKYTEDMMNNKNIVMKHNEVTEWLLHSIKDKNISEEEFSKKKEELILFISKESGISFEKAIQVLKKTFNYKKEAIDERLKKVIQDFEIFLFGIPFSNSDTLKLIDFYLEVHFLFICYYSFSQLGKDVEFTDEKIRNFYKILTNIFVEGLHLRGGESLAKVVKNKFFAEIDNADTLYF